VENEQPTPVVAEERERSEFEVQLGFALTFISGRGLLTTRDRRLGPFHLKVLELEIPEIAFPFDVTGGADRFKTRRCSLRHLVYGLDADGLSSVLKRTDLTAHGFQELKAALRDGSIEFAGRFGIGEHQADFTFRASLLVRSPEELSIVFYDARVYGWLPIPSALLPEYLRRGLGLPYFEGERAGAWIIKPVGRFLREILPRNGWKVPDLRNAALIAAEVARGQLVVVAGPEGEPSRRELLEREPPAAAIRTGEGVATFTKAEQALGRGNIQAAYEMYREAADDERGGRWARERLLQIGAADPELALETRQLAEEVLAEEPQDTQALLTLAAIALRERSWGEATNRYETLATIARTNKERFDAVAAELAAAGAATPIDPGGALAAYERAAARARDSVIAHGALFELRRSAGDWDGAAQAGERLVKLETDVKKRAVIHRDLGHLYRAQVGDFKRARLHFERALKIDANDPGALEGLAETYAARGEPARAASYLARLAEQAEELGDQNRIVSLNLRLGEIWERWLADADSAASRYYRVLDADPHNRIAHLRLAKLAEEKGDVARARTLYEDVLAVEEERGDPDAVPDLVAAYTRLARVTLSEEGPTAEAIACLERAVELDPSNRAARDELGTILRDRGEWGRLIHLLEETARVSASPEEVRHSRLHAARLELAERDDHAAAQKLIEAILAEDADDSEALEILIPILESQGDVFEVVERLTAAAGATPEPVRRADYLFQISEARATLGMDPESRRQDLEHALDANPFLFKAAEALVALAEKSDPTAEAYALDRFAVAAETDGQRGEALHKCATILYKELSRPEEALDALQRAVRAQPANVGAWEMLSRLLEGFDDPEGSRAALESAIEATRRAGGDLAPLHVRLAELARAAEDMDQEAEHLTAALDAGARADDLYDRLVTVLSKRDERLRAAELLEGWANAAEEEHGDGLRLRAAEVRRSLGDLEHAIQVYRRVMQNQGAAALDAAKSMEMVGQERGDHGAVADALEVQLDLAAENDVPELLGRLLAVQVLTGDDAGIEKTATALLEDDPFLPEPHSALAQLFEKRADWEGSLDHYWSLLLECPRGEQESSQRRAAFERTAAVVREFQSERFADLQAAFEREFPDAPADALGRTLGDILADEDKWDALLELRRAQLEKTEGDTSHLQREIGDILHQRLDRSEEAIPFYQGMIDANPEELEGRQALAEVYESLSRWGDLASLLFAMSLVADPDQALDYGLRAVAVYMDKVGDEEAAQDTLRAVASSANRQADLSRLTEELRQFELWSDLVELLEGAVEANPDPEAPVFVELVDTIAERLGDAAWAVAWCERMAETDPESDVPWRKQTNLLVTHPGVGNVSQVLRAWADARTGAERARILVELSEWAREQGDEDSSLQALGDAVDAEPTAERVIQELVDRHTQRNDFGQVAKWLERLAFITDVGALREQRLRKLVDVATTHVDQPEIAAHALQGLQERSFEETKTLARLLARIGDVEGLEQLEGAVETFDRDAALKAAKGLLDKERFDGAKRFLEQAMAQGAVVEAWDLASQAWRQANRLLELGRWRLQRSESAPPEHQGWMQLLARAELLEAGEALDESADDLLVQLENADLRKPSSAWAVFCVAQSIKSDHWLEQGARALEKMLASDDPRLLVVLRYLAVRELEAGSSDKAVEISRRLIDLGDPQATDLCERALEAAGRIDELVSALGHRAEREAAAAPALWSRIASLQAERALWGEAAEALGRVEENARTVAWAEQSFSVGLELDDPQVQAEAAEVATRLTEDDATKAQWLRRHARILWWRLGKEEEARNLLGEAHQLSADDSEAVLNAAEIDINQGDREGAARALEEGLAVLEGKGTAPLWIVRAELYWGVGDQVRAIDCMVKASQLLGQDATWSRRLGDLADQMGEIEVARECFERAFTLSPGQHEDALVSILERLDEWETLIGVLEARAEDLLDEEAGDRYAAAARIAHTQTGDLERALSLMDRATRKAPTTENLRLTFQLADELDRPTMLAALGPPLLKRLEAADPDRVQVLHSYVAALSHLNLEHEALPSLHELHQRDEATPDEKLLLASQVAPKDPSLAAMLLEEAARSQQGAAFAVGLFHAAVAWEKSGQDGAARGLLLEALGAGLDDVAGHRMAYRILEGAERLPSAARLIELGGDEDLSAEERAVMRQELAKLRLEERDPASAYELLTDAARFAKPDIWVHLTELALRELDRPEELARFYVEELDSGAWSESEQEERMRHAAAVFRDHNDVLGELQALRAVAGHVPEDSEVQDRLVEVAAQLGDKDQFLEHVRGELAKADMPDERAHLVMRYAPILVERFEDAPAAVAMVRPSFTEVPSAPLAELLASAMVAAEQGAEAVRVLAEQAEREETSERIPLLVRAGDLARGPAGDDELAYGYYRAAIDIDPLLEEPRDFCLEYAAQNHAWSDAVEILGRWAATESNAAVAYTQLIEAADIARDHLQDPFRELQLMKTAVDVAPDQPEGVTRLLERLISEKEIDGALGLLLGGHALPERELRLGEQIIEALQERGRVSDTAPIMEFLAHRHPNSGVAGEVALQRAREQGDHETILRVLQTRLEEEDLAPAERYAALFEAGRSAVNINQLQVALDCFASALDAPSLSLADLLLTYRLAERLDPGRREAVVARAVEMRPQIEEHAKTVEPKERLAWLVILSRAHEAAGDKNAAVVTYEKIVESAGDNLPRSVVNDLAGAYEKRGDWQKLVRLYDKQVRLLEEADEQAELYYRMGVVWHEHLVDEGRAGDCFTMSLRAQPDYAPAQLAQGLLLFERHRYDGALPFLAEQVDVESDDTPVEHLLALVECLRQTGDTERALTVSAQVLARDPERVELIATRAEMLEGAGRTGDAEAEWQRHLEAIGEGARPEEIVQVRRKLATLALGRSDANDAVEHLEYAYRRQPDSMALLMQLRKLYEQVGRWPEAADLRLREAAAAPDAESRAGHYKTLAAIYLSRMNAPGRAATMLERASEATPDDISLLQQLLTLHEERDDWRQYLIVGERLLAMRDSAELDGGFFAKLARAYHEVADDEERAKEFFDRALATEPDNPDLKATYAAFAKEIGDYTTYARVEEEAIGLVDDPYERIGRYQELAEVCLQKVGDLQRAAAALLKAREIRPDDPDLLRSLANTYALDPAFYPQATELYRELLDLDPLDAQTLRILARLSGQVGDNDQAYGHYAALLVLQPTDDEAKKFVDACRPAVPPGPQRSLTDADRIQGLIHGDQSGPIEDLFAPLARFAELTQPGGLNTLGVSERDQLAPTDSRLQHLSKVLEPLGLPKVAIYLWRGGGFAVRTELVGTPAILVGSTLATDATDRQRAFLVARAAELYRTGHTLAEKLSAPELGGVAAALCLAVDPECDPPFGTMDTPSWANTIAAPMTEAIRSSLRGNVAAYLEAKEEVDFGTWRWGARLSAGRVAMLLSCDVEEAVAALLRLRGMDDLTEEQRAAVIRESPEAMDLMRFAVSEHFYNLRQSLGLALRRSTS
jgi:tetratricopeptide (TPR) repeat protein